MNAFYDCVNLVEINYVGTKTQWNTISKGQDWNKGTPSNLTINYLE
jgi:hypothetical protein